MLGALWCESRSSLARNAFKAIGLSTARDRSWCLTLRTARRIWANQSRGRSEPARIPSPKPTAAAEDGHEFDKRLTQLAYHVEFTRLDHAIESRYLALLLNAEDDCSSFNPLDEAGLGGKDFGTISRSAGLDIDVVQDKDYSQNFEALYSEIINLPSESDRFKRLRCRTPDESPAKSIIQKPDLVPDDSLYLDAEGWLMLACGFSFVHTDVVFYYPDDVGDFENSTLVPPDHVPRSPAQEVLAPAATGAGIASPTRGRTEPEQESRLSTCSAMPEDGDKADQVLALETTDQGDDKRLSSPEEWQDVFVDGSCLNNGQPNAYGGVGVWFKRRDKRNASFRLNPDDSASGRAEVLAALVAVQRATSGIPLHIHSDSHTLVHGMKNLLSRWRARKFSRLKLKDQLLALDKAIREHGAPVKWTWVKGHDGNVGNEQAHKLAQQAAKSSEAEVLKWKDE